MIVLEYQSSFASLGPMGEGEGCYHYTYLLLKLKFVINLGDQASMIKPCFCFQNHSETGEHTDLEDLVDDFATFYVAGKLCICLSNYFGVPV